MFLPEFAASPHIASKSYCVSQKLRATAIILTLQNAHLTICMSRSRSQRTRFVFNNLLTAHSSFILSQVYNSALTKKLIAGCSYTEVCPHRQRCNLRSPSNIVTEVKKPNDRKHNSTKDTCCTVLPFAISSGAPVI